MEEVALINMVKMQKVNGLACVWGPLGVLGLAQSQALPYERISRAKHRLTPSPSCEDQ